MVFFKGEIEQTQTLDDDLDLGNEEANLGGKRIYPSSLESFNCFKG
jgi:hypothetical protein